MATPYAKNALTAIRDLYGYRTTILHLTCSDEIRRASDALRRKNGVVQCTEKDFVEKQALFLTLLSDYIQYSDNVLFSLRKNLEETIWTAKLEKGVLTIYDLEALQKVEEVHDAAQGQGFWEKVFYSVSK
jgi:hypothetical protein